jgi:hypothetical protein
LDSASAHSIPAADPITEASSCRSASSTRSTAAARGPQPHPGPHRTCSCGWWYTLTKDSWKLMSFALLRPPGGNAAAQAPSSMCQCAGELIAARSLYARWHLHVTGAAVGWQVPSACLSVSVLGWRLMHMPLVRSVPNNIHDVNAGSRQLPTAVSVRVCCPCCKGRTNPHARYYMVGYHLSKHQEPSCSLS